MEDISDFDACLPDIRKQLPELNAESIRDILAIIAPEKAWLNSVDPPVCIAFSREPQGGIREWKRLEAAECGHHWISVDKGGKLVQEGRYLFHPSSHFSEADLIPEIMGAASGSPIPAAVYKKYSSKQIAFTLAYRLNHDSPEQAAAFDYLDDSRVQMMFKHGVMNSIAEKGFLNQHQFKPPPGPGVYAPLARAIAEDRLIGITLAEKNDVGDTGNPEVDRVVNQVRPKYAFLDLDYKTPEKHPLAYSPQSGFDEYWYGDVVAVFNPDVNDRSTFAMGDSLHSDKVRSLRVRSGSDFREEAAGFIEAQVWGELTLKDVHHFIVNCPTPFPALSAGAIENLKKLGKPVFECKPIRVKRPAIVREWNKDLDGPENWNTHWQEKIVRYSEGKEL